VCWMMLGGDVGGGGLEGGFWGWCEGDGMVGFCVFMELGGDCGGCCLGIMKIPTAGRVRA